MRSGVSKALEKEGSKNPEAICEAGDRGHSFVVGADIRGYFDSIDRSMSIGLMTERISDRRVLKPIRQWPEAGVTEDGTMRETPAGTPQGGVISPLLANVFVARGSGPVRR